MPSSLLTPHSDPEWKQEQECTAKGAHPKLRMRFVIGSLGLASQWLQLEASKVRPNVTLSAKEIMKIRSSASIAKTSETHCEDFEV